MADTAAAPWRGQPALSPRLGADLADLGRRAEYGALIVVMLMLASALGIFFPPDISADDQPFLRLMWYPVYLLALGLALTRPLAILRLTLWNVLALAPVAMVAASTLWSLEPDVTFRRAIALGFTTLIGLYLAVRFDWRELLHFLAVVFGVLAVACLFVALAMPGRGIMTEIHPGAWSGLWAEKNELGSVMARGALVFGAIAVMFPDRRRTPWVWAGLFLCVALVLLSTSKTSLLALLTIGGVMLTIGALRSNAATGFAYLCLAGLGLTVVAGVLVWDIDIFFEALGKERSLTGRTDIWEALIRSIGEKPWLGYGYGVFWRGDYGPAYWVRQATEWDVPTAHNGWLEVALSIGLIGLAVTSVQIVAASALGVAQIWTRKAIYFALPYIALTLLFSFSESVILQRNNLNWMLFVAVTAKMFAPAALASIREAAPLKARNPNLNQSNRRASPPPVSTPLTLFRVTLRSGASMIDLSADLSELAEGLDRTRPLDGRGRVIMFTAPRPKLGVSLLSREFSRLMAQRAARGVWLFDLDFSRNAQFRAFTTNAARQRYGPIGPALDATLGEPPFWRIAQKGEESQKSDSASSLVTLHRVGGTRLFVSRFHPELLSKERRLHIRAAHQYWERMRDTAELAIIDAPAPSRNPAGRALYGEADAVVIVIDDSSASLREAESMAETIRARGGMPAGVIVNMVEPSGRRMRRAS